MNDEQHTLQLVRATIDELPSNQKQLVMDCVAALRLSVSVYGGAMHMAIALLGAELAAAPDAEG